jgi:hypothetical protein
LIFVELIGASGGYAAGCEARLCLAVDFENLRSGCALGSGYAQEF